MEKKKFFYLMLMVIMGVGMFASCSKDDDPEPEPTLEVSTTALSITEQGGSESFKIISNTDWTVTGNHGWLSVSPASGNGNKAIVLNAMENNMTSSRGCTLKVQTDDGSLSKTIKVTQAGINASMKVNGTDKTTYTFGGTSNEPQQEVQITSNVSWEITKIPDWIRVSPSNGSGNSTVKISIISENFSDEDRMADLLVSGSGASAQINVVQNGVLGKNLRVKMSNLTIMSDGFACDLSFPIGAKGYREGFFTLNAVNTLTERDIYNMLMEEDEYAKVADWTYLPTWVDPETTIVYCIAAYGNENNSDGTHKYGPMTINYIKTKKKDLSDDMYLTLSYTSSLWKVSASRQGNYGQKCDEYYYMAYEGASATNVAYYANYYTYAFLAHFLFDVDDDHYCYGPQNMQWSKDSDQFFCATWGKHRDTQELSGELSQVYKDLNESNQLMERVRLAPSEWNKPRTVVSRKEVEQLVKSGKIYRIKK